jgi:hypothetical protein
MYGVKKWAMLNLRKPALIFNIIGVILFIIGLFMQQKENYGGETLMYIGLSMGVIYWFWSIVDVAKAEDLKPFQKKFWLIIVITVPAIGGTLFHIMHQTRGKIVT